VGRFIPNENTFVGFTPAITGTVDAPKVADVTSAIDLTDLTMSLNASAQGNSVPTPSFASLFETSIVGTSQATFTGDFYRDDDDTLDLAWTTLSRGTKGYFIIARSGGIPSTALKKCEVWPVTVLSRAMANMANNTVESFTVTCAVPSVPGEDSVVAA
jgi:hypothetical protein